MAVPVNEVTPEFVIVTSVADDEKEIPVPFTNPFVARLGPTPSLTRDVVPALVSVTSEVLSSTNAVVGEVKMKVIVRLVLSNIVIGDEPAVNV